MRNHLEQYKKAVAKAIAYSHSKGVPVYQIKDGFIVAIYPGGKEVRLQKVEKPTH